MRLKDTRKQSLGDPREDQEIDAYCGGKADATCNWETIAAQFCRVFGDECFRRQSDQRAMPAKDTWASAIQKLRAVGATGRSIPENIWRFGNNGCFDAGSCQGSTKYNFSDYDLYGMAMRWWTAEERKRYVGAEGPARDISGDMPSTYSQKAYSRMDPVDWDEELLIEIQFLTAMAIVSYFPATKDASGDTVSPQTTMIWMMNSMIKHKMGRPQNQWVTYIPGFVEVANSNRTGDKTKPQGWPGRYEYAVARGSLWPVYYYVTKEALPNYRKPDGSLNYSDLAGRYYYESNYPHADFHERYEREPTTNEILGAVGKLASEMLSVGGDGGVSIRPPSWQSIAALVNLWADHVPPPLLLRAPLNLLEIPRSQEQIILNDARTVATAVGTFANIVWSGLQGGWLNVSPESVIKVATGISDPKALMPVIGQVQSMVSLVDLVYNSGLDNQRITNIINRGMFDPEWTRIFGDAAKMAAEKAGELKAQRDAAKKPTTTPTATTPTASSESGGLFAILAGAGAGFLVGGPLGAGVGGVLAAAVSGKKSTTSTTPPKSNTAPPPAAVLPSAVSGKWTLAETAGAVTLKQAGNAVSGDIVWSSKQALTLTGNITGGTLEGTWQDKNSNTNKGKFKLVFNGSTFTGTWGVGAAAQGGGTWAGKKA